MRPRTRSGTGRGAEADVAELSNDPVFRSRMQREAHTAGRLQEPHVVPIHDFGEIDGQLYVDMRLIDGKDLASMLGRSGR